jgi:hypothetical protein
MINCKTLVNKEFHGVDFFSCTYYYQTCRVLTPIITQQEKEKLICQLT